MKSCGCVELCSSEPESGRPACGVRPKHKQKWGLFQPKESVVTGGRPLVDILEFGGRNLKTRA